MLNTGHSSKKLMGTTAHYAFVLQLLSSVGWVHHSVSSILSGVSAPLSIL